jgi:hypothetical protein
MPKSGLKHIDVGPELTKTEWESEETHELLHGNSFPGSPVERQLFYRDDEHKWYIYDGTDWVWLGGGGGGGMEVHGNEYHDPDFASEASLVSHAAAATGVHGVGAGTIAKVADIAVDGNLSAAAQDAIAKRHTQNTDKVIKDADNDTKIQVEESADEDKIRMDVKGVEAFHLDDTGILTLGKQSAARAYLSGGDQKIPHQIWTQTKLNAENFDVQNEFNGSQVSSVATTGTSGTTLKDSTNPFVPGDVGKSVWHDTDGGSTTIVAYIAPDQVTLAADIGIGVGDSYTFGYSRFTARVAGKYLAVLQAAYPSAQVVADKIYYVAIKKNGAFWMGITSHSSVAAAMYVMAMDIVDLAANDYIEHWVWQQGGATKEIADGYDYTFLAIHKLS